MARPFLFMGAALCGFVALMLIAAAEGPYWDAAAPLLAVGAVLILLGVWPSGNDE